MSDVNLTPSGPPETVLPEEEASITAGLVAAADLEALSSVVAHHPSALAGWAALGEAREAGSAGVADDVAAYAAYRVGYHRGLDALRKHGWRGSGYVRWRHPSNRGFLRCLDGLGRLAEKIGEEDEAIRCAEFLRMLDPAWDAREPAEGQDAKRDLP